MIIMLFEIYKPDLNVKFKKKLNAFYLLGSAAKICPKAHS